MNPAVVAAGLGAAAVSVVGLLTRPRRKSHEIDENGNIRLLDLEHPIVPRKYRGLNPVLDAMVDRFRSRPSVESMMEEACKISGLSDFGDEEMFPFRRSLGNIVSDINREYPKLTGFGRINLVFQVTRLLVNRLRIVDLLKQHPEILEEEIKDPVFILGPPRSGTTHLHRSLGKHDAFRAIPLYELENPVITPEIEEALDRGEDDPRRVELKSGLETVLELRPFFSHLFELDADAPGEEGQLMACTFASAIPSVLMNAVNYFRGFRKPGRLMRFKFLKVALQVLQWQDVKMGGKRKRFLLKDPGHVTCLPELVQVFPDVKIIETCRNPCESFLSLVYLVAYAQGFNYREVDIPTVASNFLSYFITMMDTFTKSRKDIEKISQVVKFDDYVKDNAGCIKRVLEFLGERVDAQAMLKVMEYLQETERFSRGRIAYDASQVGIDEKEVREKFSTYTKYVESLETSGT